MQGCPSIVLKSELIRPYPNLFLEILLHLRMWNNLLLPISIALFNLLIILLDPFAVPILKETDEILEDVQSIEENALMD